MRHQKIIQLQQRLSGFSRTEIQEMGKVEKNPIRFAQLIPKYQGLIDEIKATYPDTIFPDASKLARDGEDYKYCPCCDCMVMMNLSAYKFSKFCSHKCRANSVNTSEESIVCAGKLYKNFDCASNELNLSRLLIKKKLYDPEIEDWYWEKSHAVVAERKLISSHPKLNNKQFLFDWKAQGKTQSDLAEQLGCDRSNVSLAYIYHQIDTTFDQRPEKSRTTLDSKETFSLMFSTMSGEAMAQKLEVHVATIFNYAKGYGLETKPFNRSSGEIELFDFISKICPEAVPSYREGIPGTKLELDVWIGTRNLGIEYNGCYMHSTEMRSEKYHFDKVTKFAEHGIRIVQIWEDTWRTKKDVVKKFLVNLLGQNPRIGARKTVFVDLSQEDFDVFLEANHIQGSVACKYRFGLMADGLLVSAMGFQSIPSNVTPASTGQGITLARFANLNVSGAFTKILTNFLRIHPYDFVVSYADLETVDRNTNVYSTNGFVVDRLIPADYKYYGNKTYGLRKHKFLYRKSEFVKLGLMIDGKTEEQLAKEYGLFRCYDSGKLRYLLKC